MKTSSRQYRRLSKTVRSIAGMSGHSCPIQDVDGFTPPTVEGRGYHFTTKTGLPVRYPNAYRRAWGKPVYHASTVRIVVGRGWLIENGLA